MQLPFPGMDPYLEKHNIWPDVHASLITAMRDFIQPRLPPSYVAMITPYVAMENIEIAASRQLFVPDIGIVRENRSEYHRQLIDDSNIAIIEAPLSMPVQAELPMRYTRIELRNLSRNTLITCIEMLSPANKRTGVDGADAYHKKRQELFQNGVHLLEIDLLRGGQRPRLSRPIPETAYCVMLTRAQRNPVVQIWPISLQMQIPVVPVPLDEGDTDLALPLNPILHEVYHKAQYQRQIDYQDIPPLPELNAEDAAWLDQQLRERSLRV